MWINPFYFARKGLAAHMTDLAHLLAGRTLDIGCGTKPYAHLCRSSQYIGMELDTADNRRRNLADVYYDGHRFPFGDGTFDSILSNQVFEHVFYPEAFLKEVHRVAAPGALLLVTVPFMWDEHETPWDYARYSSFGLRHLMERHGFAVIEQRKSMADIRSLFQMFNTYLYKKTRTGIPLLNGVIAMVLMEPVNVLGEIAGRLLPPNPDLFLDNIMLARKDGT